jgi:hypothetical protein
MRKKIKKINQLYCVHLWCSYPPKPLYVLLYNNGKINKMQMGFSKCNYGLIIGGFWGKSKNEIRQQIAKFKNRNWRYWIFSSEIIRVSSDLFKKY